MQYRCKWQTIRVGGFTLNVAYS